MRRGGWLGLQIWRTLMPSLLVLLPGSLADQQAAQPHS